MSITDFTYSAYINMLGIILKRGYCFANYHNYADFQHPCIMRHDIDFDVKAALRLAELEASFPEKLESTFFVWLSSDFYNVFSKETIASLNQILSMGHEIGLHFDETKYDCETPETIVCAVQEEAYILSRMLGIEIHVVSMHRPSKYTLEADLSFDGLDNSYSRVFRDDFKYLSDSRMHWREDAEQIITSRLYSKLHILTHAFWYSDEIVTTREKLLRFITNANQERYDNASSNFRALDEFVTREDIMK